MSTPVEKSHNGPVPLGFLISVPKGLPILLVHKIRDTRFQLFLVRWACTFIGILGLGIWALNLLPMFLAVVVLAFAICFYALLFWLGIGDILLKFAVEDKSFFEVATACHALNIFEDTETTLPNPRDTVSGPGERRVSKFRGFAKRQFRSPLGKRFYSRPSISTNPGLREK